jgi:hypothetical protein
MVTFVVTTEPALLIARHSSKWVVEEHLKGSSPESLTIDPQNPTHVYCGTWGNGLGRSDDVGKSWHPVGSGITPDEITAVAVSSAEGGVVYAGTEPSAVFRSENEGET